MGESSFRQADGAARDRADSPPHLLSRSCWRRRRKDSSRISSPTYLRDLAGDFHAYYNAHKFIVDDAALRNARLNLIAATRQVLANGLKLLVRVGAGEDGAE